MTTKLTLRFIVTYFVVFAVVAWLFNFIPSGSIEALTAQTAVWTLNLFGHGSTWGQSDGYTILTLVGQNTVMVSIVRECTALNVLGVMCGLILPLQTSWIQKAKGVAIAGFLLFALNIPRIVLTVYLTAFDIWPFTLLTARSLETYHYPISFAFGIIGVAVTILAVSKWATPELSETLIGIMDGAMGLGKEEHETASYEKSIA